MSLLPLPSFVVREPMALEAVKREGSSLLGLPPRKRFKVLEQQRREQEKQIAVYPPPQIADVHCSDITNSIRVSPKKLLSKGFKVLEKQKHKQYQQRLQASLCAMPPPPPIVKHKDVQKVEIAMEGGKSEGDHLILKKEKQKPKQHHMQGVVDARIVSTNTRNFLVETSTVQIFEKENPVHFGGLSGMGSKESVLKGCGRAQENDEKEKHIYKRKQGTSNTRLWSGPTKTPTAEVSKAEILQNEKEGHSESLPQSAGEKIGEFNVICGLAAQGVEKDKQRPLPPQQDVCATLLDGTATVFPPREVAKVDNQENGMPLHASRISSNSRSAPLELPRVEEIRDLQSPELSEMRPEETAAVKEELCQKNMLQGPEFCSAPPEIVFAVSVPVEIQVLEGKESDNNSSQLVEVGASRAKSVALPCDMLKIQITHEQKRKAESVLLMHTSEEGTQMSELPINGGGKRPKEDHVLESCPIILEKDEKMENRIPNHLQGHDNDLTGSLITLVPIVENSKVQPLAENEKYLQPVESQMLENGVKLGEGNVINQCDISQESMKKERSIEQQQKTCTTQPGSLEVTDSPSTWITKDQNLTENSSKLHTVELTTLGAAGPHKTSQAMEENNAGPCWVKSVAKDSGREAHAIDSQQELLNKIAVGYENSRVAPVGLKESVGSGAEEKVREVVNDLVALVREGESKVASEKNVEELLSKRDRLISEIDERAEKLFKRMFEMEDCSEGEDEGEEVPHVVLDVDNGEELPGEEMDVPTNVVLSEGAILEESLPAKKFSLDIMGSEETRCSQQARLSDIDVEMTGHNSLHGHPVPEPHSKGEKTLVTESGQEGTSDGHAKVDHEMLAESLRLSGSERESESDEEQPGNFVCKSSKQDSDWDEDLDDELLKYTFGKRSGITQRVKAPGRMSQNSIPESTSIKDEEDGICDVCRSSDAEASDPIVFCDGCDVAVHASCYGNPLRLGVPEGDWFCQLCQSKSANPRSCCLCPSTEGAMKQTTDGKWAHISCAVFVPEVSFHLLKTSLACQPSYHGLDGAFLCEQLSDGQDYPLSSCMNTGLNELL